MALELKQSTVVTVNFGPFVDKTDGVTPETGLATNMDSATTGIRVSKNGAVMIDRNSATVPAHDDDGYYRIALSATDTDTLGTLLIQYEELGVTLPMWREFSVVTANYWDTKYGADVFQADLTQMGGVAQSATDLKDFADDGYNPATNKVTGVLLTDTVTTLTGHTAQTADHTAAIADVPTVAEFNARTILSASYFDPATDTVANVTTVATTTTNTDMRGTESAALAADYTSARAGFLDNLNISENVAGTSEVGHLVSASGTSDSGGTTTMVDSVRTEIDDHWNGGVIVFGSGGSANNIGASRLITDFDAASDTLTFTPVVLTAITTETYTIVPWATVNLLAATQTSIDAIETDTNSLNDTKIPDTISLANINNEVVDVMNVDTITLPGQVNPPLTPTHRQAVGHIYKAYRNKKEQTSAEWRLMADNQTTVDQKAAVGDDGTTANKDEIVTGP